MALSSLQDLQNQKKQAEDRIDELKRSYDEFLSTWKSVKKEEYELLQQYHQYVEKGKIHSILKKIEETK